MVVFVGVTIITNRIEKGYEYVCFVFMLQLPSFCIKCSLGDSSPIIVCAVPCSMPLTTGDHAGLGALGMGARERSSGLPLLTHSKFLSILYRHHLPAWMNVAPTRGHEEGLCIAGTSLGLA